MSAEIFEDDGTLACLHLPADAANKRFFCKEERQENLIGKTFWLQGFFADVQTRYGIRHIYKATYEKEDNDSVKEIRLAVASYIGWLKYTDTINLTKTLNTFCYGKVF